MPQQILQSAPLRQVNVCLKVKTARLINGVDCRGGTSVATWASDSPLSVEEGSNGTVTGNGTVKAERK